MWQNFLNDVMRSLFHLIEYETDIVTYGTRDEKLDAGECAQENDQGGVARNGSVHNPHDNGIYDKDDTQQNEYKTGIDANLQRGFGKGCDGREREFHQFPE